MPGRSSARHSVDRRARSRRPTAPTPAVWLSRVPRRCRCRQERRRPTRLVPHGSPRWARRRRVRQPPPRPDGRRQRHPRRTPAHCRFGRSTRRSAVCGQSNGLRFGGRHERGPCRRSYRREGISCRFLGVVSALCGLLRELQNSLGCARTWSASRLASREVQPNLLTWPSGPGFDRCRTAESRQP